MGTGTWEVASASASPPHSSEIRGDAAAPHGCLTGAGPRAAALAVTPAVGRFTTIRANLGSDFLLLTGPSEGSGFTGSKPWLPSLRDRGVVRDGS